jgi:hypothetical protein
MSFAKVSFACIALLGALVAVPDRAEACGGFFCNNSQPVNQQAERIIFSTGADGSVTAVIQILYSGPSERFAWVLPVGGTPEVAVSSNLAFTRLQAATNPQYILQTTFEGTCRDMSFGGGGARSGSADGGAGLDAGRPGGVTVLDAGSVGPYDYVTIAVDPTAEDEVMVALDWLRDNMYDVPPEAGERLRPYLMGGMNLLAFRLTKGNSTGSIRPVMIRFGDGLPMIPIRPTAVAATADMGVMVFLLGEHRAVPVNYNSLVLNEALINWLSPGPTYGDVVNAAADESGGHGFVTEFAGAASPFAETIAPSSELSEWSAIAAEDWTDREGALLDRVLTGGFSRGGFATGLVSYDGIRDAVAATLPTPEGVSVDDLLNCIGCYYPDHLTDIEGFDPAAFVAAVDEQAIEPMRRTRDLFAEGAPTMTRLYTTMSPDEMYLDPVFDFNPDLPDVSNVHTANRVVECSPEVWSFEAPWRVTLASGDVVRGRGGAWPFVPRGDMPANRQIVRVGNEGEGEVVEDNVGSIRSQLREHNSGIPGPPVVARGGGCSVSRGSAAVALVIPLLGALLALVRRRRGQ